MSGRRCRAALALTASAAALAAHPAGAARSTLHGDAIWAPRTRRAPGFTLRDQSGRAFSLRAQRGKVVLLTFLDSHCTELCPLEGRDLARTQRQVRSARWETVVVSVNPHAADTPHSIRSFARKAHWRPGSWHWLTGTRRQLAAIWRKYGIEVEGTSAHSSAIYLIDRDGYERTGYNYPTVAMREVALDVKTLIARR